MNYIKYFIIKNYLKIFSIIYKLINKINLIYKYKFIYKFH